MNTHLLEGGKMMVTLAGAMSTAELGISLAEMIRQDKVDIISCTGANLEEDVMNLVHIVIINEFLIIVILRHRKNGICWKIIITGLLIPVFLKKKHSDALQKHIHKIWKDADDKGERYFPHEFMYKMLLSGD